MNKKITSFALLLLLSPSIALATQGPYMQVEAGRVASDGIIFSSDIGGFGGRVSAGYLFGENKFNYGIETGALLYPHLSGRDYGWFSSSYYTDQVIKGYGVDLLGVLKYTFDCHFLIFAKGGAAFNHQELSETYSYSSTKNHYTYNSVRPELALGIGYKFTPNTEIHLTTSAIATPYQPTGTIMLGFSYSF